MKVLKFGGSSMANAESILKSLAIAKKESEAIIVVSAPGKQIKSNKTSKTNKKVTDMLISCHKAFLKCGRCDIPFESIRERFQTLCQNLSINGIDSYLNQILHDINSGAGYMYTISRGEYLSSLIMRHLLDCELVDATDLIKFDIHGNLDINYTHQCIKKRLSGCKRAVVGGFYGSLPNGEIKTFSRGGSDVTGAIISSAINASIYENWTDVDGIFFSTHLREPIKHLTYRQARALTYMGAYVLHPNSVTHLHNANIKTVIKNTFNPNTVGTLISNEQSIPNNFNGDVMAISGLKDFKMLSFYKMGSTDTDFFEQLSTEIKKQGAKIFFSLAGVDSISYIVLGEIGKLRIKPTYNEKIALFTILSTNKERTLQKLVTLNIDYKLICSNIQAEAITIGVNQEKYNQTLITLSESLYNY